EDTPKAEIEAPVRSAIRRCEVFMNVSPVLTPRPRTFGYAWNAPSWWLHGRHAMQPAPRARHSSDCGLSLDSAKSKAKKLIRIANYRLSRRLLLRVCNSASFLARARMHRCRGRVRQIRDRVRSEQGSTRDTGLSTPSRRLAIGGAGIFHPLLPKGESALPKVSVSL